MKQRLINRTGIVWFLASTLLLLTACSQYTGLRTPLYDGQAIEPNKEAIETYRQTGEVTGAEKDYYIRHAFSEDILQKSLTYPDESPFLLEAGRYIIGEDLPAGRVTLLGNESSFSTENYDVHVGNFIIRDAAGELYFENLFHSEYGQLTAQVDLIAGHEITIIGHKPEITVFYAKKLPEDPYILMELPVLIANLDRMSVQQPIQALGDKGGVHLTAGIYEVGQHLGAGEYVFTDLIAPHSTEMYLFRDHSNPRVIELLLDTGLQENKIKLEKGDKLYLNLVNSLALTPVESN